MTQITITDTKSSKLDLTSATTLNIRSKASIIHFGTPNLDEFSISEGGRSAARKILNYLNTSNEGSLKTAMDIYNQIITKENIGGEYTALQWICKLLLIPEKERMDAFPNSLVARWFDLFAKDDFENLRVYLMMKYHFIEKEKVDAEAITKFRFLKDVVCFYNPDRENWEKTNEVIESLNLCKGNSVIDFGCGPGYYTFKFADIVGETGNVYGLETNLRHINDLKDYIQKYHVKNVDVFEYQHDGLGLKNPVKADLVFMCSLYHVFYAVIPNEERDLIIENIKKSLKEDGRFVIVDNDTTDVPYQGPYISRELIISQLFYYGFELVNQYQFIPQRYVLEFKLSDTLQKISDSLVPMPAMFADEKAINVIKVTSSTSLIRFPFPPIDVSSQGYTLLGKKAARLFYAALETKDKSTVETALKAYEELIPKERIGDEYTAFEWFCKYLLASKEQQTQILSDKFNAEYFNDLANNDFELLKKYLRIKYDLSKPDPEMPKVDDELAVEMIHNIIYEYSGKEVTFDQLNEWNEFIAFNNPNRESWEKTNEMLNYINIKDGEVVADIGCGFGFFSFKFSQLVGKQGKVYATETNKHALEYVEKVNAKYELGIQTIPVRLNDVCLPPDSIDTAFMCSVYHAVYITSIEFVKDAFIASLKKALKKEGRLVIVDNAITYPSVVPYFGSCIVKELIISQLKYYGFHIVDSKQFIPQRYILVFQQD